MNVRLSGMRGPSEMVVQLMKGTSHDCDPLTAEPSPKGDIKRDCFIAPQSQA
jgi:hypothetical protein